MQISDKVEKIEVTTVEVLLDEPAEIEEWRTCCNDIDSALCFISDLTELDCCSNHNTVFGSVDENSGDFSIISDTDGEHWYLNVRCETK